MSVYYLPDEYPANIIELDNFPVYRFKANQEVALQIAEHLKLLLESYGAGKPTSVCVPSTVILSDFYQSTVLDVLDALFKLQEQHYDYMMHGLDAEIVLYDKLNGKRGNKNRFERFNPWTSMQYKGHNCLADLIPGERL